MAHKSGIKRVNLPLANDAEVWTEFRAVAIKAKVDLAVAADEALREWIRRISGSKGKR
jgi:hypothetical protein